MRWLTVLLAICFAGSALAQPDPNAPPQELPARKMPAAQALLRMRMLQQGQTTCMAVTPAAVFALGNGVLAKFTAGALDPMGTLELFGPLPAQPAVDNQPAMAEWAQEAVKRVMPAAMLANGSALLIVAGDEFFQVDGGALEVTRHLSLKEEDRAIFKRPERLQMLADTTTPPTLQLAGNTLFVISGSLLSAVDLEAGKVIATGKLPTELTANLMPNLGPMFAPGGRNGVNGPMKAGRQDDGFAIQPDQAQEVTMVGVLVQHAEEGGFWTVKDANGDEYVLEGPLVDKLAAKPGIAGSRVRISGTVSQRMGIQQVGKGYLQVHRFQMLPKE